MYRFSVIGSLLIFLICFSASIATASYSRPYQFSDIKISMPEKSYTIYRKLLRKARAHPAKMITEKIKSHRLPGTISWKQLDLNNKLVSRTAKIEIRLTGDWTDHLGTANAGDFSSVKIKLINGNLAGIVRFRLLRYKTRYLDEVTVSLLMEMLGYPVPYRGAMAVKINGNDQFMIFEEAPVKEFIERFGFREAPIVEGNERQLWQNRSLNNQPNCLGRMTEDKKCNVGADPNVIFGKIDNKSFLKNDVALEIGNDAIISHKNLLAEFLNVSENSPIEVQVYSELVGKVAGHSLVPHNFKSIYDPMYKRSLPVFFDGDVDLNKLGTDLKTGCKAGLSSEYKSLKAQNFIQVYTKEYLSRTGQPMYENQECAVIAAFRKVERLLGPDFTPRSEFYKKKWSENYNPESKSNNVIDPFSKKFDFKKAALGHQKDNIPVTLLGEDHKNEGLVKTFFIYGDASQGVKPITCYYLIPNKQFVDCGEATFKEIRGSMAGRKKSKPFNGYKLYSIFLPNNLKTKGKTVVIGSEALTDSKKVLHVPRNTTFVFNKNLIGKHLKIFLSSPKSSRILFLGSTIKDSTIEVSGNYVYEQPTSTDGAIRYDRNHLTGCVTFTDSRIMNSSIEANSLDCEDSVNLLRVDAEQLSVKITNASSDALDADASTVSFLDVKVRNALNDCLDLSYGSYTIENIDVSYCGDKGVSIGERSKLSFNNASIQNSNVGIAVKDSSELDLNNASLTVGDLRICIAVYNKKQEFDQPKIHGVGSKNIPIDCKIPFGGQ